MRVKVVGPTSGYGPHGYRSWAADEIVEVDDTDQVAVDYYRGAVAAGGATLLEDVKPKQPADQPEPTLQELRSQAAARGLATYGTKEQLTKRLSEADE